MTLRCGQFIMAKLKITSFVMESGRKLTIDVKVNINVKK